MCRVIYGRAGAIATFSRRGCKEKGALQRQDRERGRAADLCAVRPRNRGRDLVLAGIEVLERELWRIAAGTESQGWTALVLDTNGNGKRDPYVEPGHPPTRRRTRASTR